MAEENCLITLNTIAKKCCMLIYTIINNLLPPPLPLGHETFNGSVPLKPGEKNQKIWKANCCSLFGLNVSFNVLTLTWKKIPIFKIEYLSSYNLSFRVGVLCLHWNYIEIKPRPNIQSPLMLHFLIHICEYRMTWSIDHLNIKL